MALTVVPPNRHVLEQSLINLIAVIPGEHVVSFHADLRMKLPEELFSMMANIETLHIVDAHLSEGFLQPNPDGPRVNTKLLPSFRSLCLESVILDMVDHSTHPSSGVEGEIMDLVPDFTH